MAETLQQIWKTTDGEQEIKVLTIFGTRPEAIKLAPVVRELRRRSSGQGSGGAREQRRTRPCSLASLQQGVQQGDTTTVAAASLAAFYAGVQVEHVEAGLRTHDRWQPLFDMGSEDHYTRRRVGREIEQEPGGMRLVREKAQSQILTGRQEVCGDLGRCQRQVQARSH